MLPKMALCYLLLVFFVFTGPLSAENRQLEANKTAFKNVKEIWEEWSDCSATCGTAHQIRRSNRRSLMRACAVPPCLKGKWTKWKPPGPCVAVDCSSGQGLQYSTRTCTFSDRRLQKEFPCKGPFLKADTCFQPDNCPVHGNWGTWSEWRCEKAEVKRFRLCNDPLPSNGGRDCDQSNAEESFDRDSNEHLFKELCKDMIEDDDQQISGSGAGADEEE